MYQAPATIWNAVAETGPLRTGWAEQMFPLPQEEMDAAIEAEVARLRALVGADSVIPAAYLVTMPLLWEQEAIRNLTDRVGPIGSLPPVETVDDAMAIALGDFPLTPDEAQTLRAMLLVPPES